MVVSRKLGRNERNSTDKQLRHKKMTHLENDTFRSIISWSRKDRRELKLNNPEKVALRWGIFKRNKAMTYKKLCRRTSRYYYKPGNVKKVPGQRFVCRLNKRPLNYEPGVRKSPQLKLASQVNTGSSFVFPSAPNTSPFRECWFRPDGPTSCCPRCLCPRFLPLTTPTSGEGRKILLQTDDPSLNELVFPIKTFPTSIAVSVIQKTATLAREEY